MPETVTPAAASSEPASEGSGAGGVELAGWPCTVAAKRKIAARTAIVRGMENPMVLGCMSDVGARGRPHRRGRVRKILHILEYF